MFPTELDSRIALVLAVCSLVGTFLSVLLIGFNPRLITISLALLAGALSYLVLRNSSTTGTEGVFSPERYRLVLNILFILLLATSTLALFENPYHRPLSYFVMVSLMCGLVVLETSVSRAAFVLPKIFAIGFSLQLGILYNFPGVVGVDAPGHLGLAKDILSTGGIVVPAIQQGSMYTDFPATHLSIVTNMLVLGIDYKDALTVGVAFPFTTITLSSAYLLGRRLFDDKTGLLGALIVVIFPFSLWLGYVNAPITFGIALIPLFVYFFLNREPRYWVLGLVVLATLCLSHPLAMAMVLVIAMGLFLGSVLHRRSQKTAPLFPLTLIVLILLARWMYLSSRPMFEDVIRAARGLYEKTASLLVETTSMFDSAYVTVNVLTPLDYAYEILNTLGIAFLIFFATIGLLHIIRRQQNLYTTEFFYAAILFSAVAFVSTLLSLMNIIPHRWLAAVAFFLALLAAIGISRISLRKFVPAILMVCLAFLMITNSVANMDSPIYAVRSTVRYAFTAPEIAAAKYTYQVVNVDNVYTDWSYFGCFRSFPYEYESASFGSNETAGFFLIRDYIFDHAFYVLGKDIRSEIGISFMRPEENREMHQFQQTLSRIYANDEVGMYYAPNKTAVTVPKVLDKLRIE